MGWIISKKTPQKVVMSGVFPLNASEAQIVDSLLFPIFCFLQDLLVIQRGCRIALYRVLRRYENAESTKMGADETWFVKSMLRCSSAKGEGDGGGEEQKRETLITLKTGPEGFELCGPLIRILSMSLCPHSPFPAGSGNARHDEEKGRIGSRGDDVTGNPG